MNREQIKKKTETSIIRQLQERGYATCVDCMIDIGWLKPKDLADWRNERLSCLEITCCTSNAHIRTLVRFFHQFAKDHHYKTNWTCYRRKKTGHRLRFTKNNDEYAEQRFAMHIVCMECKKEKQKVKEKNSNQNIPKGENNETRSID